jgi:RNA polymerase sigma-70 factor (ECF subfamily)
MQLERPVESHRAAEADADLDALRPLLFSIAYRLLGSAADAEDIVQESFVRYESSLRRDDAAPVQSPKALLSTITTRLCLDELKSARKRREQYYGPWLPEPVLTEHFEDRLEQRDTLSLGFLLLLERLSPPERAVFVLREAFDYSYDEIASMLDRSVDACRQLHHRARRRLAEGQVRFEPPERAATLLAEQFLAVAQGGDLATLTGLLADDAVLISDGGGKAQAAPNPIRGADRIARFLQAGLQKSPPGSTFRVVTVNGGVGGVAQVNGQVTYIFTFGISAEGRIQTILAVANPDKLAYAARQLT